ncbi:hypothetical protein CLOM_g7523 [Closterium sp. NIES-68]|nr:hypothetical protein CLOM_g7523 [Closterium sp. NIES-68]GJP80368.1 hypothetical protein CLOP_g10577 [Closterium sp. NIES-67]
MRVELIVGWNEDHWSADSGSPEAQTEVACQMFSFCRFSWTIRQLTHLKRPSARHEDNSPSCDIGKRAAKTAFKKGNAGEFKSAMIAWVEGSQM